MGLFRRLGRVTYLLKNETLNDNITNMITVNEDTQVKYQNLGAQMLENRTNNTFILNTLGNLGRLPRDFDGSWLLEFLDNESSTIRFLAVKNLGKLKKDAFLVFLTQVAKNDPDTNVRREAVSAIGRMRKPDTKKILFAKLKDADPKVVLNLEYPPFERRSDIFNRQLYRLIILPNS